MTRTWRRMRTSSSTGGSKKSSTRNSSWPEDCDRSEGEKKKMQPRFLVRKYVEAGQSLDGCGLFYGYMYVYLTEVRACGWAAMIST